MNGSFGRLERSIAHPSSLNGRLEVEVNVEESSCVPQSEKEGHSSDVLEGRVDCEEKRSRSDAAPRWREEEGENEETNRNRPVDRKRTRERWRKEASRSR